MTRSSGERGIRENAERFCASCLAAERWWMSRARKGNRGGYKPDSVPLRAASIHLGSALPPSSSDLPGSLPRTTGCGDGRPSAPLFGLAPHGVYHASAVTGRAVRSYRTLSPSPTADPWAVFFLRHFPSRCRGRALPGVLSVRSPDFPPLTIGSRRTPTPSVPESLSRKTAATARGFRDCGSEIVHRDTYVKSGCLARSSHQLSTAAGDAPRPAVFSHFGVLDGLSSTPPRPSTRKQRQAQHLTDLITKPGDRSPGQIASQNTETRII